MTSARILDLDGELEIFGLLDEILQPQRLQDDKAMGNLVKASAADAAASIRI